MLMSLISVLKENKKDKDQIIAWGIKKKYPQFGDDVIINTTKGFDEKFNVGLQGRVI